MYSLDQLTFPKTGAEIVEKAIEKIDKIKEKRAERKRIVLELSEELGIKTAEDALLRADELGIELSAANSVAHSKLQNAVSKSKYEKEEIGKLWMIVRNLPHDKTFDLQFDALRYFEF